MSNQQFQPQQQQQSGRGGGGGQRFMGQQQQQQQQQSAYGQQQMNYNQQQQRGYGYNMQSAGGMMRGQQDVSGFQGRGGMGGGGANFNPYGNVMQQGAYPPYANPYYYGQQMAQQGFGQPQQMFEGAPQGSYGGGRGGRGGYGQGGNNQQQRGGGGGNSFRGGRGGAYNNSNNNNNNNNNNNRNGNQYNNNNNNNRRQQYNGQQPQQQQRAQRGGMRYNNYQNEALEVNVVMNYKDYAAAKEASAKTALREVLGEEILSKITQRRNYRTGKQTFITIYVYFVVEKKYVAGYTCGSRSVPNVFLTEKTAQKFMDITSVVLDNGSDVIEMPSGGRIPKHISSALKNAVKCLAVFDETITAETAAIDSISTEDLALKLVNSPDVFNKVVERLQASTNTDEKTTELFKKVLAVSIDPATTVSETSNETADASTNLIAPKGPNLYTVAQGAQMLKVIYGQAALRAKLFEALQAGADKAKKAEAASKDSTIAIARALFKVLFSGVLTSSLVFTTFGVHGNSGKVDKEIDTLCACVIAFGDSVFCENGGSCTICALLNMIAPLPTSGTATASDDQQKDDDDDDAEEEKEAEPKKEKSAKTANAFMPASISEIVIPTIPSDTRLLHALAAAFTGVKKVKSPTEEEVSAALKEEVESLTKHIIACRTVQMVLPYFIVASSQSDVDTEKKTSPTLGSPEDVYRKRALAFVERLGTLAKESMMSNYGNYVVQTLVADSVPYAAPNTAVAGVLENVLSLLVDNAFDVSTHKFASNCAEKAMDVLDGLPKGNEFVLRLAHALTSKGPRPMTDVALNSYGNYVVRRILEQLSGMATKKITSATEAEYDDAVKLEKTYFDSINSQISRFRQTTFGTGVISWVQSQSSRLQGEKQHSAAAALAASAAAAAAAESASAAEEPTK